MCQGKTKMGYIDVNVYKREYETKTTYHYGYETTNYHISFDVLYSFLM
jgi:hypothetical protein